MPDIVHNVFAFVVEGPPNVADLLKLLLKVVSLASMVRYETSSVVTHA